MSKNFNKTTEHLILTVENTKYSKLTIINPNLVVKPENIPI